MEDDETEKEIKNDLEYNEWDLQNQLFTNQIAGYFRIAFSAIKPKQEIRIDFEYIETLRIQKMRIIYKYL